MSTLFQISVVAVSETGARCRFEVCHPDQWSVPASKYIALATVVELFHCMKEGFHSVGDVRAVIGKREAATLARIHPQRERLNDLLGYLYGRKVEIDETEFRQLENGDTSQILSSYGRSAGVFYKRYREDEKQFRAEAEREIVAIHLEEEFGNPKANEGDPYPKATLVFEVKEPSLIFHLVEGFCFESAMFDVEAS